MSLCEKDAIEFKLWAKTRVDLPIARVSNRIQIYLDVEDQSGWVSEQKWFVFWCVSSG